MRTRHSILPDAVNGYPLDRYRWEIITPRAATNLIANPSFEIGLDNWSPTGIGALRLATAWQQAGMMSLLEDTNDVNGGAFYGETTPMSFTAGVFYWASLWGKFAPGASYQMYFASTAGTKVGTATTFIGRGWSQRVAVGYQETATLSRRLYVKRYSDQKPFYIDAVQVERDRLTDYLDGSLRGNVRSDNGYFWTGQAHASTSSRLASTLSGGVPVRLSKWFTVMAMIGLGVFTPEQVAIPRNLRGGSTYQRTLLPLERNFDLAGALNANDPRLLDQMRDELGRVLQPFGPVPQPIVLRCQYEMEGDALSRAFEIPCFYNGGLDGQKDNYYQERLDLSFRAFLPFVTSGRGGGALNYYKAFASASFLSQSAAGSYTSYPATISGGDGITNMAIDPITGNIYVGGSFTDIGGSGADYLARFNVTTQAFEVVKSATAISQPVGALKFDIKGLLYVGGSFSDADGILDADGIATYNPATNSYAALGSGVVGSVWGIEIYSDGTVWVGGSFTDAGGTGADNLAVWNPTTAAWSIVPGGVTTSFNNTVLVMKYDPNSGKLFIGGIFTDGFGIANADYILYYNGTFTAMSTGANAVVRAIDIGADAKVYIAGDFSSLGGVTIYGVGVWNGHQFFPLGPGLRAGSMLSNMFWMDGVLYISGYISGIGSVYIPDLPVLVWNGVALVIPDFISLDSRNLKSGVVTPLGVKYFGFSDNGAISTGGAVTATNAGSADAYPTFRVRGPGRLRLLQNLTTGEVVYFDRLTLQAGEEVILNFQPGNAAFTSNLRGKINGKIAPGSDVSTFHLVPGDNSIYTAISVATVGETGDGSNQISLFSGSLFLVEGLTALNTSNGIIYTTVFFAGGANYYTELYANASKTIVVGHTANYSTTGLKTIIADNSSGLSGSINVTAVGPADSDIVYQVPMADLQWGVNYAALDAIGTP